MINISTIISLTNTLPTAAGIASISLLLAIIFDEGAEIVTISIIIILSVVHIQQKYIVERPYSQLVSSMTIEIIITTIIFLIIIGTTKEIKSKSLQ